MASGWGVRRDAHLHTPTGIRARSSVAYLAVESAGRGAGQGRGVGTPGLARGERVVAEEDREGSASASASARKEKIKRSQSVRVISQSTLEAMIKEEEGERERERARESTPPQIRSIKPSSQAGPVRPSLSSSRPSRPPASPSRPIGTHRSPKNSIVASATGRRGLTGSSSSESMAQLSRDGSDKSLGLPVPGGDGEEGDRYIPKSSSLVSFSDAFAEGRGGADSGSNGDLPSLKKKSVKVSLDLPGAADDDLIAATAVAAAAGEDAADGEAAAVVRRKAMKRSASLHTLAHKDEQSLAALAAGARERSSGKLLLEVPGAGGGGGGGGGDDSELLTRSGKVRQQETRKLSMILTGEGGSEPAVSMGKLARGLSPNPPATQEHSSDDLVVTGEEVLSSANEDPSRVVVSRDEPGSDADASNNPSTAAIRSIQRRLEVLSLAAKLQFRVNEIIERAMTEQESVSVTMEAMLEALAGAVPTATVVQVRTLSENFTYKDYIKALRPGAKCPTNFDIVCEACDVKGSHSPSGEGWTVLAQALRSGGDGDGEVLGTVCLTFAGPSLPESQREDVREALRVWSSELNKYLQVIFAMRRRHVLRQKIAAVSRAQTVFTDSFDKTLGLITEHCKIETLLCLLLVPSPAEGLTVQFKLVRDNVLVWDTIRDDQLITEVSLPLAPSAEAAAAAAEGVSLSQSFVKRSVADLREVVVANLGAIMAENTLPLRKFLGLPEGCLDIVMRGADQKKALARVLAVASADSDGEMLDVFSDAILQQISGYYSKWQSLASSFSARHVKRLLNTAGYRSKYLTPKVANCVVLFVDVSAFTRLSEEVLADPALIMKFIDTWGAYCVSQIKAREGVFDKMVGDCAIGIFGPPFFTSRPEKLIADALNCAIAIRNFTRDVMPGDPNFPQIRNHNVDLGVSTGINFCSLAVGFCGPDQAYTGFSSGMNETARVQSLASKHEILVMEAAASLVKTTFSFSDLMAKEVKNVSQKIQYRRLLTQDTGNENQRQRRSSVVNVSGTTE
jgi:class 3 adenylate cyclase